MQRKDQCLNKSIQSFSSPSADKFRTITKKSARQYREKALPLAARQSSSSGGFLFNIINSLANLCKKSSPSPQKSELSQVSQTLQRNRALLKNRGQKLNSKSSFSPQIPPTQSLHMKPQLSKFSPTSNSIIPPPSISVQESFMMKNTANNSTKSQTLNLMQQDSFTSIQQKSSTIKISIEEVISQMNVDGSFPSQVILKQIFPDIYDNIIQESQARNVPITVVVSYVVAKWIEIHHPQKQYALIAKKAMSYAKKSIELDKVQFLDEILH